MNKDEILNKAKKEMNNEYEETENNSVIKASVYFMIVICVTLWIIRVIHADVKGLEIVTSSESLIILCGYAGFLQISLYKKLKEKINLYIGLVLMIAFVASFINFIIQIF